MIQTSFTNLSSSGFVSRPTGANPSLHVKQSEPSSGSASPTVADNVQLSGNSAAPPAGPIAARIQEATLSSLPTPSAPRSQTAPSINQPLTQLDGGAAGVAEYQTNIDGFLTKYLATSSPTAASENMPEMSAQVREDLLFAARNSGYAQHDYAVFKKDGDKLSPVNFAPAESPQGFQLDPVGASDLKSSEKDLRSLHGLQNQLEKVVSDHGTPYKPDPSIVKLKKHQVDVEGTPANIWMSFFNGKDLSVSLGGGLAQGQPPAFGHFNTYVQSDGRILRDFSFQKGPKEEETRLVSLENPTTGTVVVMRSHPRASEQL